MSTIRIEGFHGFSQGTMGDGGQNLYVSKKGVLQRIFRFDTTNSGYTDILITNSHEFNEKPHLQIIEDPAGKALVTSVLTDGAHSAAVCDLNGDGCDDIILCAHNNGHHGRLASFVYYGGPDGITQNRKIELAAPVATAVAAGDFNGDGLQDLAYIVEDNTRLRVYTQSPEGFCRSSYVDLTVNITHLAAGDLDGDGYCDLYCRIKDVGFVVLWGSKDGFSLENCTKIGDPLDDGIFALIPFGGGNLKYYEAAAPKLLSVDGRTYLFCPEKDRVRLVSLRGRQTDDEIVLDIPAVIAVAAGSIEGSGKTDLVLLSLPDIENERALVFYGSKGFDRPVKSLPVLTPRDVIIEDFTGNGYGDIAVCQGRDHTKFTTESLLFLTDENGVREEPKRFVTHDAVRVLAGDTTGSGKKQLIFVNHQMSNTYGHVPIYIYLGGEDGYRPDRRIELPGHSPGTLIPADFNDDGWPDILLVNDAEDQPHLDPPSDIFWGSENGFDPARFSPVPSHLAWGATVGDINRDGYLDILTTCGNELFIHFGSENGYSLENTQILEVAKPGELCGLLWPTLADFNGDGWLDLCLPLSHACHSLILWGGPDGFSMENTTRLPVERAVTVRAADLNGNGYLDLIFGTRASIYRNEDHEGSVCIFWGGPKGYSSANCCELPSYQTNCITVGDFNNDGYPDIFASSYFNGRERDINSYIYWNDRGHFSVTNRKRMFAHSSSAAQACDYNGDGYVDLMLTHHRAYGSHRAESALWWNGPEGFDEKNRTWLPTLGPHDMVSVEIGNIRTRGNEEFYLSPVFETGGRVSSVAWLGDIPKKTWVNAQIRTADDEVSLGDAPWIGIDGTEGSRIANGEPIPAPFASGRLVQVKLYLGAAAGGNTPRLTSLSLHCGE